MFFRRDSQSDFEPEQTRQVLLNRHTSALHPYRRRPSGFSSSGISANAPVRTSRGRVAARDLRVGDMIYTLDHGLRPLRWLGRSRSNGEPGVLVRFRDEGQRAQILFAPQHLVHLRHMKARTIFGTEEVLCPAKTLLESGRFVMDPAAKPNMVHLLFDCFELIQVGPIWVESFVPDMPRIRLADPQVAEDIIAHIPRLAHDPAVANYVQDRLVLDDREVSCLFAD